MIDWHRIFGLSVTEHFRDTSYTVELEKDLSLRQQLLDVVIVERGKGEPPEEFPDGLGDMSAHNLITYKSHRESLDDWALDEFMGYFVNYRKQVSPSMRRLLPLEDFRMYAVSTRHPEKLAGLAPLAQVGEGVYDVGWAVRRIRIIVLSRIPRNERNALWLLFSTLPDNVRYGAEHCRRSDEMSTLINDLFRKYQTEGIAMPYTMEDYRRDYVREHIHRLQPEERLRGLPPEERLRGLPPEERLRGLPPEERLRGLGLSEDEVRKITDIIRSRRQTGKKLVCDRDPRPRQ